MCALNPRQQPCPPLALIEFLVALQSAAQVQLFLQSLLCHTDRKEQMVLVPLHAEHFLVPVFAALISSCPGLSGTP